MVEDPVEPGSETVVVVDDQPVVLDFCRTALERAGYTVFSASSGEQALSFFEPNRSPVDLALIDVVMPGMDGATLARLVRMERPAIRVILMSGYSEDVAPGLVAGEYGMHFLPKPFSLKQLIGAVKETTGM